MLMILCFSLPFQPVTSDARSVIVGCVCWFCLSGLTLNPDESDAIFFSSHLCAYCYSDVVSVNSAGSVFQIIKCADEQSHDCFLYISLMSYLCLTANLSCYAAMTNAVAGTCSCFCLIVGANLDNAM